MKCIAKTHLLLLWLLTLVGAARAEFELALEMPVIDIALTGSVAVPQAELSALGWCGRDLWLVPQYPNFKQRDNHNTGHLYRLSRQQIMRYLSAWRSGDSPAPLEPAEVPLTNLHILEGLPGYQGIEAFACQGDNAALAIEINRWGRREATVLARIHYRAGQWQVGSVSQRLLSTTNIPNKGNEALLATADGLLSLPEISTEAHQISGSSKAFVFAQDLLSHTAIAMADIPYRITDATALDYDNRFWVVNYLWSGERALRLGQDPFWLRYGRGDSHANSDNIERLIELQWTGSEVVLTDRAPINLQLTSAAGRNWEGIVRLDSLGFLLVTDKHPGTLLGFVPYTLHD